MAELPGGHSGRGSRVWRGPQHPRKHGCEWRSAGVRGLSPWPGGCAGAGQLARMLIDQGGAEHPNPRGIWAVGEPRYARRCARSLGDPLSACSPVTGLRSHKGCPKPRWQGHSLKRPSQGLIQGRSTWTEPPGLARTPVPGQPQHPALNTAPPTPRPDGTQWPLLGGMAPWTELCPGVLGQTGCSP